MGLVHKIPSTYTYGNKSVSIHTASNSKQQKKREVSNENQELYWRSCPGTRRAAGENRIWIRSEGRRLINERQGALVENLSLSTGGQGTEL